MEGQAPERAWLLMAAGDNRGHGGNLGYDDQIDAYYSWDSNVPNYMNLQVGDPIALWDKQTLLGISVIEEIQTTRGPKLLHRCPECRTTRISERKRALPQYRCMKCQHEFEAPEIDVVVVDVYRARYDAAWTSLEGLLSEQEVRSLALHPGDINAMRPIDWGRLRQLLLERGADRAVGRATARIEVSHQDSSGLGLELAHGFTHAFVRVRRGQQAFRDQLLAAQGNLCAFTGPAPPRVLEAGHLYSYAEVGTHHEYGGLMLRRDIHRLFDDGALAVNPDGLRVDVSPELDPYPQYARLRGVQLTLELRESQVVWLAKHWTAHRTTTK